MNPARRIAFVTPRLAEDGTVGGAETLIRALANRAAHTGRDVTLLSTCARSHVTWANELPPGPRPGGGPLRVILFPVDPGRDPDAFARAQAAVSRGQASPADEDAWLAHNVRSSALEQHLRDADPPYERVVAGPYLWGLTLAVARLMPERTLLLPCLHDEPFARVRAVAGMFGSVSGLIFNSEPERELAARLFRFDPARASVVGMGLDPFNADPQAFAASRQIHAPYVIYSGRREPMKGTPLLLDYMAAFRSRTDRDVKLVLTGSGPIAPPDSLAPHTIDVGFVSEEEKHQAMAGALAFIHPSVNESLSIVLLESWLAGTPALVHAEGTVLRDHCRRSRGGLWFANYPEFEEELELLIGNPGLRRTLGGLGKRYVMREYAWPTVESRLLAALDRPPAGA